MNTRGLRNLSALVLTPLLALSAIRAAPPDAAYTSPASQGFPLMFVENVGQFDERARFQVHGGPGVLWLADDALWITLAGEDNEGVNLRLSFPGANPHPHLEPFDRLDTTVHYYLGNDPAHWHTGVPVWGGVRYVGLYPGVDLEITGKSGQLTWQLLCPTGCRDMRLRVEGAESIAAKSNTLHVVTTVGDLALPLLAVEGSTPAGQPTVTRTAGGAFEIAAPFSAVVPGGPISQQADAPEEVFFGTYLGGGGYEWADDIAVDGEGDIIASSRQRAVYVTGWTTSSDFPTDPPGGTSLNGPSDVFVTKLSRVATYVSPDYSAYIGGSIEERGTGIAVDGNGNAYVAGWTRSDDFPTTSNAFDPTFNSYPGCTDSGVEVDAFVAKLDSTGTLTYATYLGGSYYAVPGLGNLCGDDDASAIAVDAQGVVYVTGYTLSEDFPTTPGAYDEVFSNFAIGLNEDTFVVKLDPAISGAGGLLYGTYVGGGTPSRGKDITIDTSGIVYVIGESEPDLWGSNYFPTTPGAYDTAISGGGGKEPFVFKLNPAGNGTSDMQYATFLGGSGFDYGDGIAVDSAGLIYATGSTASPDFPTTSGALDTTCGTDGNCNSRKDVSVSKLNPAGSGQADLLYSTYLGGNYFENFFSDGDIALGSDGDVYVTGQSGSDQEFPLTSDAYDATPDPDSGDAFVTRLRLQGNNADDLVYSTFVGNAGRDEGIAIALDGDDRVYVAGNTGSSSFPTTQRAFDKVLGGSQDAFVIRLLAPPAPDLSSSTKQADPNTAAAGQVVTFTVQLINSGALSTTVSFTDTLPAALLLHGSPTASSGSAPSVNGQAITWSGLVTYNTTVAITYATLLTSSTTVTPTTCNEAQINDGYGNVYDRRAYVNGHFVFLPLVLRNW
jgi:uncharacterized repeat protein (TIGR01451 family)